jgi:rhodanese-related sulfurtransferase
MRAPAALPPGALRNPTMLPPHLWIRRCALLAALLAGGVALPAHAGAIPTHEAREGCSPASEGVEGAGGVVRDASCYVTARELARWRGGSDLVIVDPRPSAEFRRVRIPGSINLPLRQLLSRPYLRSRRLLLVDAGYLGADLEVGCRELRAAGFVSVGIVEGGLNAWAQTMGDLEGDRVARRGVNRIPARDLALATRSDHWLVVDVSVTSAPDLEELLPGARSVPLGGDPAAFRQELSRAMQAREGGSGALFVAIVGDEDEGSGYDEAGRALSSLGVVHAFFLEGGLEALRNLRAAQSARLAQAQVLGGGSACEEVP